MRTVTAQQRRQAMIRHHHLPGDADGPEQVCRDLIALHATDPASVYLSVLARSATTTLAEIAAAMYERRGLVRWMAMRRTLFVFSRDEIPLVQAAVSTPLARMLRTRLLSRLDRNGTEPAIDGELADWLLAVENRVELALARLGSATGGQLSAAVPELATMIEARAASERPQRLTSSLLTLMSADGRLVRAVPTGAWTSRHHRWEPVAAWWPDGMPDEDPAGAQCRLAQRWLARFGPATAEDLQWWTGWNKSTTASALAGCRTEEVDLHGRPGIALAGADETIAGSAPVVALLPALDPTPMGWKHREWFFAADPAPFYDRAGNIGPTVWWDGEIVGSWAVVASGEVRSMLVADRGTECQAAVDEAAGRLQARLDGAVVTPVMRTPLESSLS